MSDIKSSTTDNNSVKIPTQNYYKPIKKRKTIDYDEIDNNAEALRAIRKKEKINDTSLTTSDSTITIYNQLDVERLKQLLKVPKDKNSQRTLLEYIDLHINDLNVNDCAKVLQLVSQSDYGVISDNQITIIVKKLNDLTYTYLVAM